MANNKTLLFVILAAGAAALGFVLYGSGKSAKTLPSQKIPPTFVPPVGGPPVPGPTGGGPPPPPKQGVDVYLGWTPHTFPGSAHTPLYVQVWDAAKVTAENINSRLSPGFLGNIPAFGDPGHLDDLGKALIAAGAPENGSFDVAGHYVYSFPPGLPAVAFPADGGQFAGYVMRGKTFFA